VEEGEVRPVTSTVVLFELKRVFLRLGKPLLWNTVGKSIVYNCEVKSLTPEFAERSAEISHGTGLHALDAMIVASCEGVEELWTTDRDMEKASGIVRVKLLS